MLKRGWVFAIAVVVSFSILTLSLNREDFTLRRMKQPSSPAVEVSLSESFVMGLLEALFTKIAEEAKASREEFKRLVRVLSDSPPDAELVIGMKDMDPAELERALADSPWGRLKDLMKAVGMYCSEDVQHKVILFLLGKANPEAHLIRTAAKCALRELFPHLNRKQRIEILCYIESVYRKIDEERRLAGDARDTIGEYIGVISGFIPRMSEEEISALSKPFLTAIALHCAVTLVESDINILSKVIKYLDPHDQWGALIGLLFHFGEEDDLDYKAVVALSIGRLIIDNLPHCWNEAFLNGVRYWVDALSESPATQNIAERIKVALEDG